MSLVAQPAQPTFEQHETKEPRLVDPDFASLEPAPPRRRINRLAIGVAVLVLTAIGIGWYVHAQGFEETDDAQVDGHINPITSRIDGTVTVSYTHLRAHETRHDLVCRLLLEKKK